MITHKQIEDFWNGHFGHMTDAHHQNAKAQLHALLGTDAPKLEDKAFINDLNKGIINVKEIE